MKIDVVDNLDWLLDWYDCTCDWHNELGEFLAWIC